MFSRVNKKESWYSTLLRDIIAKWSLNDSQHFRKSKLSLKVKFKFCYNWIFYRKEVSDLQGFHGIRFLSKKTVLYSCNHAMEGLCASTKVKNSLNKFPCRPVVAESRSHVLSFSNFNCLTTNIDKPIIAQTRAQSLHIFFYFSVWIPDIPLSMKTWRFYAFLSKVECFVSLLVNLNGQYVLKFYDPWVHLLSAIKFPFYPPFSV